ncbi:MAG TPA: hypothetical protein VKP58_11835 [Candidatus Acidoferrum sp.]|nr:hypothetical protein [Candidatus Acidoferrum sp.]
MARKLICLLTAICLTLPPLWFPNFTLACGPFFESAVFTFQDGPDGPDQDFAAGKLGILLPGFHSSYLVVAYRYLSDVKLSSEQQAGAVQVWQGNVTPGQADMEKAVAEWRKARGLPPQVDIARYAIVSEEQPYSYFTNCNADAFQTATRTLQDRIAKYGATSAELEEWVAGQDQVFANCGGESKIIPAAISAGPPLLLADRAYQIAAANFYARNFDDAVKEFDAIAQDPASPWAGISPYLAARALIRKANLLNKPNEDFDPAAMSAAQARLERILSDPRAAAIHQQTARLLNFILFRTEPKKRVAELGEILLKPGSNANFSQDLWDFVLLLSHGENGGELSDWIKTLGALTTNSHSHAVTGQQSDLAKHSLTRWHETRSLPWLIAALTAAKPDDTEVRSLLTAAQQVSASSPGYLTVRYYALRLMIATGQLDPARKELDLLLAKPAISIGSRNLLNEQRLALATSLEDFLRHAPETPVPSTIDYATEEVVPDDSKPGEPYFSDYVAKIFQKRLPLPTLVQAAESPTMPKLLRRDVARSAWVRSVLLGDLAAALELQPALHELDQPLWTNMESFRLAKTDAEKHFAALVVILSNPGMKPSVRGGLPRSTTFGELDRFRDNWWCTDMEGGPNWGKNFFSEYNKESNLKFVDRDADFPFPSWLTDAQKSQASSEWAKLGTVGAAPNILTRQVLAYANEHPGDPSVPMALHLAVRSTRFGCANIETTHLSKAAFDLLHQRYPQTEWTKKTPYWY